MAQSTDKHWADAAAQFQHWIGDDGAALRDWLIARTPDALHPILNSAPLWGLAVITVAVGFAALWGVISFFEAVVKGMRFAGKATTKPGEAIEEVFNPQPAAKQRDVAALEKRTDAQSEVLAAVLARLDTMQAQLVAAGAAPLGAEERVRRNVAVGAIVADAAPAAKEAAKGIASGDLDGAIATLKRDALADVGAAAEKWRRIAALARGINDAEAFTAYQEAFALQPDDFWTSIELSRLNVTLKGDVVAARQAAEAAERAARDERETGVANDNLGDVAFKAGDLAAAKVRYEAYNAVCERLAAQNPGSGEAQRDLSVSYNNLGDVAVKAGDLAGGKARYEAALAVREGLAAQNPGSALAQRDVWVSMWRLAKMQDGGVTWLQVLGRMEAMKALGVLGPNDESFLVEARELAGRALAFQSGADKTFPT